LQVELAQISLIGDREDNQDRVGIIKSDHVTLALVFDGMGGHSDGSRAAETALKAIGEMFNRQPQPLFDPLGFMHLALSRAHDEVVRIGLAQPVDARPRATAVVVLVQSDMAYWGHVGDSRIYQVRQHTTLDRTRDHSHVEMLLREGRITEADIPGHPMRNFVECCLGGDPSVPEMTIAGPKRLLAGDVLLLCTDGIWSTFSDEEVGAFARDNSSLQHALEALGKKAVTTAAPHSDNSTAAALRFVAT